MLPTNCELCREDGGEVLLRTKAWRVVLVDEPAFPGFCRVVWNQHVMEMTDLTAAQRAAFMEVVWRVERCIRDELRPTKINLASLGNFTPHLHWHVIPRWENDTHFPRPIWGEALRPNGLMRTGDALQSLKIHLTNAITALRDELESSQVVP